MLDACRTPPGSCPHNTACRPAQQRCTCQGKMWRWLSFQGTPPPHCRWGLQSCCLRWPWHAWATGTFSRHPRVCRSQRQRWAQCAAVTVLACGGKHQTASAGGLSSCTDFAHRHCNLLHLLLRNACMNAKECKDHSPAKSSAQATAFPLWNVPGKCRSWGREGSFVFSAH